MTCDFENQMLKQEIFVKFFSTYVFCRFFMYFCRGINKYNINPIEIISSFCPKLKEIYIENIIGNSKFPRV